MAQSSFQRGDLVVVTGAAQGLGQAIALRLARDGARLALWDIEPAGLQKAAALCREQGAEVTTAIVDTSETESVMDAAKALPSDAFGLVNNAGIFPRASILEADVELWRRVMGINLIGYFLCIKALLPGMLVAGRGAVVNISSTRALYGAERGAHYAASKAGVLALTKSAALEAAPHVRVNCVIPGLTETAQPLADMSLEELHLKGAGLPLGRAGKPEDIAGVVSFMLGADAQYMTGQSISVNGGASMIP
jgi:NAD(P)-dependent dehydrogenase (short-subunit alcohol dehydrogenase family)